MHTGNLVFAQLMEFAPWHTFRRLVAKYRGDFNVRTFSCLDQFLSMALAQLTYRESLRDIEACLRAQPTKLYHMGLRGMVSRSALADANESRDWRIYAEFAYSLIRTARRLYAQEPLAVDLAETVYALDATTIDLCLSLFPWEQKRGREPFLDEIEVMPRRGRISLGGIVYHVLNPGNRRNERFHNLDGYSAFEQIMGEFSWEFFCVTR
jgi:hypothetical protein